MIQRRVQRRSDKSLQRRIQPPREAELGRSSPPTVTKKFCSACTHGGADRACGIGYEEPSMQPVITRIADRSLSLSLFLFFFSSSAYFTFGIGPVQRSLVDLILVRSSCFRSATSSISSSGRKRIPLRTRGLLVLLSFFSRKAIHSNKESVFFYCRN